MIIRCLVKNFKSIISLFVFLGLCFFVVSCKTAAQIIKFKTDVKLTQLNVSHVMNVDSAIFSVYDISHGNAYSVSRDRSSINVFNLTTEVGTDYRLVGEGPGKIRDIHTVYGVDGTKFIVHDKMGVYMYNFKNNKFSFSCEELYKSANVGRMPSGFSVSSTKAIVPSLNPHIPMNENFYYENPEIFFFSEVDLKTCTVYNGGSLVENSPYNSKNLTIRQRARVEKMAGNRFLLYFQYDKNLQIIDIDNFEVLDNYMLATEFKELVSASDRSLQEMTRLAQLNPAYISIKITEDSRYVITQYLDGSDEYKKSTDYLDGLPDRPRRFFEVYDLNTKKRVGKRISGKFEDVNLVKAISLNEVYLSTNFHEESEGTFIFKASFE